jgi:DnaJ-class molecular chaperone
MKSFYEILQVNENASEMEIKKSYRTLSLKYHPDKNADLQEQHKFIALTNAYEVLSDKAQREQYDRSRNTDVSLYQNLPMSAKVEEVPNIQNIQIPSKGVKQDRFIGLQTSKPEMIQSTLHLQLHQVLKSGLYPIEIERYYYLQDEKRFERVTLYVEIFQGIDDNEMIIIPEQGHINLSNIHGDIKVVVKIENKTEFLRKGLDIIYRKTITLKEALCGFQFQLTLLSGKQFTVNNKEGNIIQPNYEKSIPMFGLSRGTQHGSLVLQFTVEFPTQLSKDVIKKLKQII